MRPEPHVLASVAASSAVPAPLGGRWRRLAQVAWLLVCGGLVALFVASLPTSFRHIRDVCVNVPCVSGPTPPPGAQALRELGLSVTLYAATYTVIDVVVALVYLAVASIIFRHASQERIGLLAAFTLLIWGLINATFTISAVTETYPAWRAGYEAALFLGIVGLSYFCYLFPDGRFVSRWSRWFAIGILLLLMPAFVWPSSGMDFRKWSPVLGGSVLVVWMGSLVAVQVYRYRCVSSAVERQQTKWAVGGIAGSLIGFFGIVILPGLMSPTFHMERNLVANMIVNTGMSVAQLLIPVSIGFAILRRRLWDIDLIIHRTLVYGSLTLSIVGLYVVIVGGLGTVLQMRSNLFVSLLATAVVAVLFAPLRDRLQRSVNRLLYGERDDPYAVISGLGQRLAGTPTPGVVPSLIVETVRDALKLPYVAIALHIGSTEPDSGGAFETVAESGVLRAASSSTISLPLRYQGMLLGRLVLAPRAPGEPFSPRDRRLLDDLVRQSGAALYAAQVTADLQRSREQLVVSREEERRRIRNDLHDGIGPELTSLIWKLETARNHLAHDAHATSLLAELATRARTTVAHIRRVVYNLRPPALDDLGLGPALCEMATMYSEGSAHRVQVRVDVPESLPPLPAAVEVAVYRIAQEALANAVRHADAATCRLQLRVDEARRHLSLEVRDDGRGMAGIPAHGIGLHSMRERAAELGGTCVIAAGRDGGTVVQAWIPLR